MKITTDPGNTDCKGVAEPGDSKAVAAPPNFMRPWEMSPKKRGTPPIVIPKPAATVSPVYLTNATQRSYATPLQQLPFMTSTPFWAIATRGVLQHYPMLPFSMTQLHNDSTYSSGANISQPSPVDHSTHVKSVSRSSGRRLLNPQAVHLMKTWYQANHSHPYPDDEVVNDIASEGNISHAQVKKWMANKRVRSFNTLSFNGSMHPRKKRRMQCIQQVKERFCGVNTAPTVTPHIAPHQASKENAGLPALDTAALPPIPEHYVLTPFGWSAPTAAPR